MINKEKNLSNSIGIRKDDGNKTNGFCNWFSEKGTTTLEVVLKNLGYRGAKVDKNLIKIKHIEKLKNYIKKELKRFDAVQNMAWSLVYKELYELYPEAKFILTYRNLESWIKKRQVKF